MSSFIKRGGHVVAWALDAEGALGEMGLLVVEDGGAFQRNAKALGDVGDGVVVAAGEVVAVGGEKDERREVSRVEERGDVIGFRVGDDDDAQAGAKAAVSAWAKGKAGRG